MAPETIVTIAQSGAGGVVVLAFFIAMFIRGDIVARPFYDDLKANNALLRATLERSLTTAEQMARSLDTIKRQIEDIKRQR